MNIQNLTESFKDEIVRAGAGAGKTTALVQKVLSTSLHWKDQHGNWPRWIVTTFTKKATQELRERLTIEACTKGDLSLLDFCNSSSKLHISTIHGVLNLFLRRYGHLGGLNPTFSFIDESSAQKIRRKILKDCFLEFPETATLLEHWSFNQIEQQVTQLGLHQHLPNLRPSSLEDKWVLFKNELAENAHKIDFFVQEIHQQTQNESWRSYAQYLLELKNIIETLRDGDLAFAELKTAARDSNPSELALLKINKFYNSLSEKVAAWHRKPSKRKGESLIGLDLEDQISEFAKKLKDAFAQPSSSPLSWPLFTYYADKVHLLTNHFFQRWNQMKSEQSLLELEELEQRTLTVIRNNPALAQAFSADWDFWCIDEFQDTSPVQVEILDHLINKKPRYIVGDPQQSIYLFRGANVSVFKDREDRIRLYGKNTTLRTNYRSQPDLLHFFNDFFLKMNCQFEPMNPRSELTMEKRTVATFFSAEKNEDGFVRQNEYEGIVHHIKKTMEKYQAPHSDFLILARRNQTLYQLAQFLKTQGLPTHVHGSQGFLQRREIRDALALLKFLVHPFDDRNIVELLRSPWFRIPDMDLAQNIHKINLPIWTQLIKSSLQSHPTINSLLNLKIKCQKQGFILTWEQALVDFGFFDFCNFHDSTGRREANLWKLVSLLNESARKPGFKILDFVYQTTISTDFENKNEGDAVTAIEPNVINLMTVHGAKGLQNKHIVLPHCDEAPRQSYQNWIVINQQQQTWSLKAPVGENQSFEYSIHAREELERKSLQELEERDRLLYVALTRAQETVFLSWTGEGRPGSWLKRWNWSTQEQGIYENNYYLYEVLQKKTNEACTDPLISISPPHVRPSWMQLSDKNHILDIKNSDPKKQPILSKSVTSLIQKNNTESNNPLSYKWIERGVMLHQLFEQIGMNQLSIEELLKLFSGTKYNLMNANESYSDQTIPDKITPNQITPDKITPDKITPDKIKSALDFLYKLETPPFMHLLRKGYLEWGFKVLQKNSSTLEGKIDLWGETDSAIWIVDYKTGDSLQLDKAFAQLSFYGKALKAFGHIKPMKGVVIYPFMPYLEIRDILFNDL
ncbi:MAG: UvrD-helicase domain-containing protein [Bdellovibrionales bacterium]|nr:UvrD-helicase domain-containing protein [Bdellovibrionales bacterium]